MRKSVLTVTFTLLTITPLAPFVGACFAQQGGIVRTPAQPYGTNVIPIQSTASFADFLVGGGTAFFGFGGGEIPVRDATTRSQTTITAIKTTAMLVDMLIQALTGGGPENQSTGGLIQAQAEIGQPGSVLYGQYSPSVWTNIYKEDITYEHGDWVEDETLRDHTRLTTQMDLMEQLKMRQDAFPDDMAHLHEVKSAIDGCEGRNCAIQAAGAASVSNAWQQLQTQQLLMTIATSLANQAGGEINDATQKRAQQRYVMTNGGRSPQLVAWGNDGLANYGGFNRQ